MDAREVVRMLRRNALVIAGAAVIGVLAAVLVSALSGAEYEARSTVFVSTQNGASIDELQQGSTFTQGRVTTYTALVTMPLVVEPVIEELDLDIDVRQLERRISAGNPMNTTLIEITVADSDPDQAARIANALAVSLTQVIEKVETPTAAADSPVRLTVVQRASPATSPSSPDWIVNIAIGLALGLAVGILAMVIRETLDTKVRSPHQVRTLTEAPVLGSLALDPRARRTPLIAPDEPGDPRAEAFRALRSNIQFVDVAGAHTFVMTSSVAGEGKSTTAANLAIALAENGARVALVDGDLRRPMIASYLGIEGAAGLTDVLIGRAQLEDVMVPWGARALKILPAGQVPPNPSELLGSPAMGAVLDSLESAFDIVIVDSPPLLPVTDAAILARRTSGAILLLAIGKVSRHQVRASIDALDAVGAHLSGLVLSMVPTKGAAAYGYGTRTGYGYTSDTSPTSRAE